MPTQWNDDDLVYVDPDKRLVVGLVEWSKTGDPKPLERSSAIEEDDDETEAKAPGPEKKVRRRIPRKRYYPWGTYRTMKKLFRLEGKEKELETYRPLDEAMGLAMEQPYWD